jgi:methylated-DNA-protein-cysteine methyltransferase-like protein
MKDELADNFREKVYVVVASIPRGRVMTYGDIAGACGSAHAARVVGGVAHFGPADLPWQRVVNRFGGLASGYYGGREQQKKDLEAEEILVSDDFIVENFREIRWNPFLENARSNDGLARNFITDFSRNNRGKK